MAGLNVLHLIKSHTFLYPDPKLQYVVSNQGQLEPGGVIQMNHNLVSECIRKLPELCSTTSLAQIDIACCGLSH